MKYTYNAFFLCWWLVVLYSGWEVCANGAPIEVTITNSPPYSNAVLVTWETVPGKSYNLISSADLALNFWAPVNQTPLLALTNHLGFLDTNVAELRYYRVVELNSGVAVKRVGIAEQAWRASDVWVPATLSHTVSAVEPTTLITVGAWWGGSSLPTDTLGAFSRAVRRLTNNTLWPVQVQMTYQTDPQPGRHDITPPGIGASGDGFFLLLEASGLNGDSPIRDSGYATDFRPSYPPDDPIDQITVTTEGTGAMRGDLAVAIFVMDNISNPDIQISLPEGWVSLGYNDVAVDNIGYRACYKVVSSPGVQTASCSWSDPNGFVAEAAIVIFTASDSSPSLPSEL